MAYIKIDETNRITAASHNFHCGDDEICVEIPNEIDLKDLYDYLYVDGKFVHDPIIVEETPVKTMEERILELEKALSLILSGSTE